MRCRGGSSMGDRVVSALLTTQRGLPPTALPPHHPTSRLPRRMMLRKHHPSSGQLLSKLSNLLPGPDNLRPRGVLQGQLCSQSATQGGSRSASQPANQPARHPVSQPVGRSTPFGSHYQEFPVFPTHNTWNYTHKHADT